MSDKLYDTLFESWQKMSNPALITESEVRAAFPTYSAKKVAEVKAICEGYLKLEEIMLGNSTEVLLERFAGDDQAMVPGSQPFDPEATIGKQPVPAAPKAAQSAKKPGAWDKMKGMVKGGKEALAKGKEFFAKVKELYTKYNGNKILIILAAGLVVSMVVPLLPGGAAIAAAAKVAFGGFNIFKGGKGFWNEFNKQKKDRSTVKLVLAVLQTGLGIFSGIQGGSEIASQISALKQQVVSSAGDAATQAAPAPADPAPADVAPADPAPADAAQAAPAPDMTKYSSWGTSKASEMQGDIQNAMMDANPKEAFGKIMNGFAEKIGDGVSSGKITSDQAEAIFKGFAQEIHNNNGGVPAEAILKKLLSVAHIK